MVIFNKKWKKYNEIQLTKNKMDLNIRKMTNHPPSPEADELQTSQTLYTYNSSLTSQCVLFDKNQFTYTYHYNGLRLILKLNFQMKNEIKLVLVNTGSNLNLA